MSLAKEDYVIKIIEELWRAAREEGEKILAEARSEAERIKEEARRRAEEAKARKLREIRERAKRRAYQKFALKKLEIRRDFSIKKSELLGGLVEESVNRVKEIVEGDEGVYLKALKRLSVEAILNVDSDEVVVYLCNERDKRLFNRIVNEVVEEVKAKGKNVRVRVADEVLNCMGGVLVVSADGKEYFNNTIEARITRAREEYLPAAIADLHGTE